MKLSATWLTILGLVLAAILFVSVNSLSARFLGGVNADLTQEGLFTLSDGTKAILKEIDEPITLKFYYSKRLGEAVPTYGVYAQRVEQLLRDYATLANGKIRLEILDPAPFSEVEDQATAAGLQGARLDEAGEQVYFGLVGTNSTDDTETIPFFQADREKFLEYDLTKLVQSLAFPKKKVVGLISSLPLEGDPMAQMRGQPSQPAAVLEQLRQVYEVKDLQGPVDKIPDDIGVLFVAQPVKLPPKTEYAIDQFVLGGGHVLVFADPHAEMAAVRQSPMMPPMGGSTAEFDRLLNAWGVELIKGKLVGDRQAARKVNAGGMMERPVAADYILWLSLKGNAINPNDPVTGRLTQLNLATAGAIEPTKTSKTKFEPLLQTSNQSELVDASQVSGPIPDVLGLLRDFKPTGQRYTLAARVTGIVDTAFPDGPPKDETAKTDSPDKPADKPADPDAAKRAAAAQLKIAQKPINVIVVADADMLDDRFWIQFQDFLGRKVGTPIANNGDFVENAVDSLLGSGELIELRSRGSAVRPFTLVDAIQRDAQDRYQAREKDLQDRLHDTETKLANIKPQDVSDTGEVKLTPDQQKAVDQLRTDSIRTRTELRQVQLALRQNIDRLKERLVLVDVGLVPLLVAIAAIAIGIVRVRRRLRRATLN
jgi:ABC-type uncharacterized transport system involved in gliding motility auxiliary subunit